MFPMPETSVHVRDENREISPLFARTLAYLLVDNIAGVLLALTEIYLWQNADDRPNQSCPEKVSNNSVKLTEGDLMIFRLWKLSFTKSVDKAVLGTTSHNSDRAPSNHNINCSDQGKVIINEPLFFAYKIWQSQ